MQTASRMVPAPPENAKESYRAGFDGLRAVAVSLVWLSHLDAIHFYNGVIGVDIFFVLSGYLITGVLAQEHAVYGRIKLPSFYARRFLRLAPALWLLLVASLLWYALESRVRPGMLGAIVASALYFMNYNRIFHWTGEGFLGHTWSLSIEEQFYFLWPMVLVLTPRRWWLLIAAVCAASGTAWRIWLAWHDASANWIYNSLECRIDLLLLGCAVSLAGARLHGSAATVIRRAWPLATFGLAAILFAPSGDHARAMAVMIAVVGLLSSVLILAIESQLLAGWLISPPIVKLGRISYGVYLWHYPLLGLQSFYGFRGFWLLSNIPITLAVAALSFRYVERPLLSVKERLVKVHGRLGTG